jgi:hypothetical protein
VVVLAGSWLSQRLKAAGYSSRVSRGILASAAVMAGGCILPFIGFTSVPDFKLAILIAGTAIGSTIFVAVPLVVSELTPQSQRAGMLAIVNSIMTLGGVIAPFAMGVVVQGRAHAPRRVRQRLHTPGGPPAGKRPHRPALHSA